MKVALIAPTYLPARRANTFQVMKMAQAMVVVGHEVRVAAPTPGLSPHVGGEVGWDFLAHHYGLQHPFPVEWLAAHPRLRRYDYALHAVQWARRWEAELLYTRLPQAAALASLGGIPTILEVHDLPQGRTGLWIFRGFLKGRGARRLVVISHALAADLAQKPGAPDSPPFTVVAPDGVDLERYENLPSPEEARKVLWENGRAERWQADCLVAGYSGHLYSGRGVELLLALAARLPKVVFLLMGGEPQEIDRFRDVVIANNLDNVILTGFVPNADLPRYQAACDLLLMPYQRRVAASSGGDIARYLSPMKLFEYLACGRAILSSDLPVLREVLSPENAVLLPPEDVEAWVTAIQTLGENPKCRFALAAQARCDARRYSWEERVTRVLGDLPEN
jgi:glycosyltransferase involved in cell wall biosynthesis